MTAGEYGPAYSFSLDMDNDYFVVDVHYDASSGPIDEIQFEQKLIENSIRQDILAKTGQHCRHWRKGYQLAGKFAAGRAADANNL